MNILNKFFAVLTILLTFTNQTNAQLLQQPPVICGTVVEQMAQQQLFSQRTVVEEVLDFALSQQGKPYRAGVSGPNAFDCSGFTRYVFAKFGYNLDHSAQAQYGAGTKVEKGEEQPGDLVFFGGKQNHKNIGHVGIVIALNDDGFDFVHASSSRGIRVDNSTNIYWTPRYRGACRII